MTARARAPHDYPRKKTIRSPMLGVRRPRVVDLVDADLLLERLRDARARVRLGLSLCEELDQLLDDAAETLEITVETAKGVLAHEGHGDGELVWVPGSAIHDVLGILAEDEEEDDDDAE